MRVQFVQTTGWYSEGGQSTWGFGIEVHHFAEEVFTEPDGTEIRPQGWQIDILLGTWAIQISNEAGFKAILGESVQYYGRFSVSRP